MSAAMVRKILELASALPEGGIVCPKDFLRFGTREIIDQSFLALVKSGDLLRVGRGLYTKPVDGYFGRRKPSVYKLVEALSRKTGETIVDNEGKSANDIGLSMQVPIRAVYLTSGRTRIINPEGLPIELRHVPSWKLLFGDSLEGKFIRGLDCIGIYGVQEDFPDSDAWRKWRPWPEVDWEKLSGVYSQLPSWMIKVIEGAAHA